MELTYKNIDYSIKFRTWAYARSLSFHWIDHLKIWAFRKWNSNTCDVWVDKGFRILGIEFNKRTWLLLTMGR